MCAERAHRLLAGAWLPLGLLRRNFANLRLGPARGADRPRPAIVGAYVGLALPTDVVQTCLGAVILGIAVLLLVSKNSVRPVVTKQDAVGLALGMNGVFLEPSTGEVVEWKTHRTLLGLLFFIAIGIMAGMFGLGAGWANVPVLNLLMGVPLKVSVGTSKFLLSITDTSAAWIYLNQGCVIPLMAIPSIVGLMLGSVVGVRLLHHAPKFIRYMVIIVLFFSGAKALMKASAGSRAGRTGDDFMNTVDLKEIKASPAQLRYADTLFYGALIGFVLMLVTYALYVLGVLEPQVPLDRTGSASGLAAGRLSAPPGTSRRVGLACLGGQGRYVRFPGHRVSGGPDHHLLFAAGLEPDPAQAMADDDHRPAGSAGVESGGFGDSRRRRPLCSLSPGGVNGVLLLPGTKLSLIMRFHGEVYEPENARGLCLPHVIRKILRPVAGSARGRVPGALPLAPAADDRIDGGGFRGSSADHVRFQPRPALRRPWSGKWKACSAPWRASPRPRWSSSWASGPPP